MLALVTGGAGFIGGHLIDALLNTGWEVISVDDKSATSTSTFYNNKSVKNYQIDISDRVKVQELSGNLLEQEKKIDYVFHLAARTKIQLAIDDLRNTFDTNVMGTINVLDLCREHDVKRFILSSTSAVYGNNSLPNSESQIPECLNPYSASKLCCEQVCDLYTSLYGIPTVKLRYFNVFGERMPNRGIYAPVVSIFIDQEKNNLPLTIIGDGSQSRDFVYVKDVARANILAARTSADLAVGEVFNVGAGEGFVIKEIADYVSTNQINIPTRKNEADATLADISKIKDRLGWLPLMNLRNWLEIRKGV